MIKISNFNKTFGNNLHVLKDVSLTIDSGKTTVIIGPSGSGKSTLLRCLNLLETPQEGTLQLEDQVIDFSKRLTNKEILDVRRKTSMVFQSFNLFPHMTVLGNIIEGPIQVLKRSKEESIKIARELLNSVGLSDKEDYYPSQLSGGQQQRTAIARSLAMEPKYLLFDEPTSALDPESEVEVLKVLKELSDKGNSMVIVTHNMNFAREAGDVIVFLEDGKICFEGTPEEVYTNCKSERIKSFIAAMS